MIKNIKSFFTSKRNGFHLIFGSGNLAGITHVGVLKTLQKNEIYPDYIVGCSIGSIIGAFYALNPDTAHLEEMVDKLGRWDLLKLFDVGLSKKSLIKGEKVRKFLAETIGDKSFSDLKIPLKIVATDLEKGEEVILQEGKLIDAIMASISIPGIFPPVKIKNRLLVDGGITNPTPISVSNKKGVEKILAVDLTMKKEANLGNPNVFQIILRSYEILRNFSTRIHNYKDSKNILVIRPDVSNLDLFKKEDIRSFIQKGEDVTEKNIKAIKSLIKS